MIFVRPIVNLKNINWVVLDVDGTLTDGNIYYSANGEHMKHFNIHDSAGLMKWLDRGKNVVIISGDKSKSTVTWAKHIGVKEEFLIFSLEKDKALENLMKKFNFSPQETVVMGDDDLDLPMKGMGRFFICPRDSHSSVIEMADMITDRKSGDGAVRELMDLLLVGGEYKQNTNAFFEYSKLQMDKT